MDLARGLAVLGMFAAHLLALPAVTAGEPDTWIGVAAGRSSILFAVLAGVSLALVSGGAQPVVGAARRLARRRIALRAALVWAIGAAIVFTGVPVFVILPAYALLFLLALPAIGLSATALWSLAGIGALTLPWLQPLWNSLPLWQGVAGDDLSLLVGWHYPFTVWIVFVLVGLAIGRSALGAFGTQLRLVLGGVGAVILALVADVVLSPREGTYLAAVLSAAPHSSGILEVVGSAGSAVATIGVCLLLGRTPASTALLPLRAVGAMPLTAYVAQLVVWAMLAGLLLDDVGDLSGFRALSPFWPFVVGALVLCTAWALLCGRGPLERFIAYVLRRAAPRGVDRLGE